MNATIERERDRLRNVLEVEIAVVAKRPARERNEQFRERRMNVHEIGRLDVLGRELAKVHFVKSGCIYAHIVNAYSEINWYLHNTVWLRNPEQANCSGDDEDDDEQLPLSGREV